MKSHNSTKSRCCAEHSSFWLFSFQHFSFTQTPFFPRNPLFPSLGTSHGFSQRQSSQRQFSSITAGGLHAYDGHIQQVDLESRTRDADAAALLVMSLCHEILAAGMLVPRVFIGGTPTFAIRAVRSGVECSPGTFVLWDAGSAENFPDLDFLPTAALLTRVVSRPGENLLCLDLGHKAVASEMPQPRVVFPALPEARWVMHNEEHLVLETSRASSFPVGTVLYGIPWHICPTVAWHATVHVVENRRAVAEWPILARARKVTI